ncbi:smg5 nonsense mediated mRNA decay factor [Rhynchophorus ferrugineus]|uniref:smg5 nonsense mediated mRNA decay factor n=1 Tax=Rhynchophorus ferrugineus TaxID=354439 RepID=UPI003FCE1EAE
MKKAYNLTDIQQKEGLELSKKIYRTISEQAKRLDDARSCIRTISDLFTPILRAQRRKFCDYCERLIFSDPILYGRKGEELLWRKGFYEVVSTAKKLKKNEYSEIEIAYLKSHLDSGVGFYHHMLSKLQWQYKIELRNIVDCDLMFESSCDIGSDISKETMEWAKQSVHQCLIYLGDLCRYKLEIQPNKSATLAIRYYLQAVSYKPDYGMPHNQMGTLAMNQNNFLDATYHYLRCLCCKYPFEGTSNNLQSLFEKNSKVIEQLPSDIDNENADCIVEPSKSENIKNFTARFLLLIDIWYFNKKVNKVYSLCHKTNKNLEECLTYTKIIASDSGASPITELDLETTTISSQMLFKIVIICLLTISKLQSENSPQLSTLIAFTLSIYSQIIKHITNHIQEAVLNYPLPEDEKKSNGILKELMCGNKRSKSKLRRRKVVKVGSDDDSDLSEGQSDADYSSSDDSFMSDTENVLVESSDEEMDADKVLNDSTNEITKDTQLPVTNGLSQPEKTPTNLLKNDTLILKKVQKMNVNDMLEIINEEGSLQSIKVMNDWLKSDQDIIKSCGTNTQPLIRQMVYLINLVNINVTSARIATKNIKISDVINKEMKIPLSEDIVLKGVNTFETAQKDFDWDYLFKKGINVKEESIIRIIKILAFGKILTKIEETGVSFDEEKNVFLCNHQEGSDNEGVSATAIMEELERQELNATPSKIPLANGESKTPTANGSSDHLNKMKHMGQLWLDAEVRALETKVGSARPALSPYLVVDADALIKYTHMVKQLVHSRKFIVIVPGAVVSALDDLKKQRIEARDAIRWLESQFHRGNRFFRSQRPHERTPIPFIKYPKRKDKEMHLYIHIIECCHFFADQQKNASNVVTFLMGNQHLLTNGENKEFSYLGLAQSVGIVIEPIASFYNKWKKGKGNR